MKTQGFACILLMALPFSGAIALAGGQTSAASTQTSSAAAPAPAPKTEDQAAFSVIGISVRTSRAKEAGREGEIPPLWRRLMRDKLVEQIPDRTDSGLVAVYSDFGGNDKSEYTYTLGARVASTAKAPEGFAAITVPAGKYAVVETDQGALPEVLPKTWHRIFQMSPAELGGEQNFKVYYEQYPVDMDWQNAQVDIHIGLL